MKFSARFTEFNIKFNAKKHIEIAESPFMTYTRVNRGGGGGRHEYFEYSPRKWPKSHTQKLFLSNGIWQNSILSRCPQLPVPVNTLYI